MKKNLFFTIIFIGAGFGSFINAFQVPIKRSISSGGLFSKAEAWIMSSRPVNSVVRNYIYPKLMKNEGLRNSINSLDTKKKVPKEVEHIYHQVERNLGIQPADRQQLCIGRSLGNNVDAYTLGKKVFISENRLDILKNKDTLRPILSHELVHAKNNDTLLSLILEGKLFRLEKALLAKPSSVINNLKVLFLNKISSIVTQTKRRERRADTDGCYATNCSVCVRKYADSRKYDDLTDTFLKMMKDACIKDQSEIGSIQKIYDKILQNTHDEKSQKKHDAVFRAGGYLTSGQLYQIADDLAKHDMFCDKHNKKEKQ